MNMNDLTERQIELLINALAYYRAQIGNQHPDTISEVEHLLQIFREQKWAKTEPKSSSDA